MAVPIIRHDIKVSMMFSPLPSSWKWSESLEKMMDTALSYECCLMSDANIKVWIRLSLHKTMIMDVSVVKELS
jgi:hypothetical protein